MLRLDRSQLEKAFASSMQVLKRLLQMHWDPRRKNPRMEEIRTVVIQMAEIRKVQIRIKKR